MHRGSSHERRSTAASDRVPLGAPPSGGRGAADATARRAAAARPLRGRVPVRGGSWNLGRAGTGRGRGHNLPGDPSRAGMGSRAEAWQSVGQDRAVPERRASTPVRHHRCVAVPGGSARCLRALDHPPANHHLGSAATSSRTSNSGSSADAGRVPQPLRRCGGRQIRGRRRRAPILARRRSSQAAHHPQRRRPRAAPTRAEVQAPA